MITGCKADVSGSHLPRDIDVRRPERLCLFETGNGESMHGWCGAMLASESSQGIIIMLKAELSLGLT